MPDAWVRIPASTPDKHHDNREGTGAGRRRRVVFTVIAGTGNVKTHVQGAGDDTK